MFWYEAQERGKAVVAMAYQFAEDMSVLLEVPAGAEVWNAGSDAWRDGLQAMKSIFYFSVLVGRPVLLGLFWAIFAIGRFFYEKGGAQVKEATIAFWKFQTGLSRKGLMIEATICALLMALYLLRRWLQRNQYIRRARRAVGHQMERASQVSYFMFILSCSSFRFLRIEIASIIHSASLFHPSRCH